MPPSPGGSGPVEDGATEPAPRFPQPTATTCGTDTLPLHADAAAFCTTPGWRSLLAAGGYELDEGSGTRAGLVRLYDTRAGSLRVAGPDWRGPGVLDAAWAPPQTREGGGRPLLGLAAADGTVALLAPTAEGGGCEGEEAEDCSISLSPACPAVAVTGDDDGSPALALAAAWQRAEGGTTARLAASTSAGRLAVLALSPTGLALETTPWAAHSLEAWCVAWGNGGGGGLSDVLFSGADDAAFKGWDVRTPSPASASAPSLAFGDARAHGAGVTAIAPHPTLPGLVVTGSYDERARAWDARAPGRPLCVSTFTHAGGGVWRLRWHPADPALLLVAGMHAGFCILRAGSAGDGEFSSLSVAETYPHQATLAYGCDWRALPHNPSSSSPSSSSSLVATASFYDNLVHLWAPGTVAEWG
jgi:diphthine methyl ester acylhydrolase